MGKPASLLMCHIVKVKMPPRAPLPSLPEADERWSLGRQSERAVTVAYGSVAPALTLGSAVELALVVWVSVSPP